MNCGPNIFDFLESRGIAYHVSDPARTESENLGDLIAALRTEQLDFAFAYLPELDGLLHRVGNQSPEVGKKLHAYELWLERLLETAAEHYKEIRLYVFSDHGMANCDEVLNLKALIEALPVRLGKDYAVVYDSTMARFWFFSDSAEQVVVDRLRKVPQGRILPDEELEELHCLFPDRYFGELIFLVKEGVLIVPSHMGERPIRAMHGYHPYDKHSYAALLSNQAIPESIHAIPDLFRLMTRDAEIAKAANALPDRPQEWIAEEAAYGQNRLNGGRSQLRLHVSDQ
jgi:predicted AlkP superfamily pyrophosphatase or phosphodiesterase